ncbi:Os02g0519950 [Oryza sativa Japonica Group]|uniref:Os02g0519950 protein n=1 Tax=Oryza sativa subsp. japonica TaxID=39947 RepID=A0A0P0VJL6_ORYSJ|nr:Os02g0519950 [Oryza sativa Japonica Group]
MQTSRESNSSLLRVDLDITKECVFICCHNDIGILNDTGEGLIGLLTFNLKLKEAPVHLVHSKDRPNPLTKGLAKHSFSLHTDTLNTVNNHQSTISNTKSSSDLRRKINVPR